MVGQEKDPVMGRMGMCDLHVGCAEHGESGSLVAAAGFEADEAVFDLE